MITLKNVTDEKGITKLDHLTSIQKSYKTFRGDFEVPLKVGAPCRFKFETRDDFVFKTSTVLNVEENDTEIIVYTRNSVYHFEKEKLLSVENVSSIFNDCLFETNDEVKNPIKCDGITITICFNPTKIEEHKDSIYEMLKQLPIEFMKDSDGGMSFLMACNDRDGNLWTGSHQTMEQLFLLGMAIEKVVTLMPKELWYVLPGGMPYYVIK